MCNLVMQDDDGMISIMSGNDWALAILKPRLAETVPIRIQKLFEVARGSMLYGYFFYPLFTLAFEQLTRVAEAAVDHKCREMGRLKPREKFADKIEWLADASVITEKERWDAIRNLRNRASHPKDQTIFTPGMVLGFLVRNHH